MLMSPRTIDVSLPVGPDLMTWPGDPAISLTPSSRMSQGDPANVSRMELGTHTGTHVDPPYHFIDGAPTVDQLDLDVLSGDAFVADLHGATAVGASELTAAGIPEGCVRLLLKTSNSELWRTMSKSFPDDYVALSQDGAQWAVEHGIEVVGIDFLSVEARDSPGNPVHKTLLHGGVIIVEGLNLGDVTPGAYRFICMPIKIHGGDGAPARAVLIER
jgi:arylformamidase